MESLHGERVIIMNKLRIVCLLLFSVFLINGGEVKAANGVSITDNKDGTIDVSYNNTESKMIAIQVRKSGSNVDYNYFCPQKAIDVSIPMTLGNGTYSVKVLKNTSGNSYSNLDSTSITLKLSDEKAAFLTSSYEINWNSKNQAIKKANSLTKSKKKDMDKIKVIYKYIVENYSYDTAKAKKLAGANVNYVPDIDEVYSSKKGICYDISSLNASMLRSVGIETKMIKGYPKNPSLPRGIYHAWNKVYDTSSKKWIIIDATTDMQLYKKADYKAMSKSSKQYPNEMYIY